MSGSVAKNDLLIGREHQQGQLPHARTVGMSSNSYQSEWELIVGFVRKHNCSDLTFNRLNVTGKVDNSVVRLSDDDAFTQRGL